jgi:Zn ribbon nucleic-acid-binding protein
MNQPEVDICPDCKEHADFEWDEENEAWYSECCGGKAYGLD